MHRFEARHAHPEKTIGTLPEESQKGVSLTAEPQRIPDPTGKGVNKVWMIVLSTLAVVVVGGMLIIWQLVDAGKEADIFVGFVGAALGALIGLITPGPDGTSS